MLSGHAGGQGDQAQGTDSTSYVPCGHILSPWPSPCLAPGPNHVHPLKPSSSPETLLDCLAPSPSPRFTLWVHPLHLGICTNTVRNSQGTRSVPHWVHCRPGALGKYQGRVCLGLVNVVAKSVTSVQVCSVSPLCPRWASALALAGLPCAPTGQLPFQLRHPDLHNKAPRWKRSMYSSCLFNEKTSFLEAPSGLPFTSDREDLGPLPSPKLLSGKGKRIVTTSLDGSVAPREQRMGSLSLSMWPQEQWLFPDLKSSRAGFKSPPPLLSVSEPQVLPL